MFLNLKDDFKAILIRKSLIVYINTDSSSTTFDIVITLKDNTRIKLSYTELLDREKIYKEIVEQLC